MDLRRGQLAPNVAATNETDRVGRTTLYHPRLASVAALHDGIVDPLGDGKGFHERNGAIGQAGKAGAGRHYVKVGERRGIWVLAVKKGARVALSVLKGLFRPIITADHQTSMKYVACQVCLAPAVGDEDMN